MSGILTKRRSLQKTETEGEAKSISALVIPNFYSGFYEKCNSCLECLEAIIIILKNPLKY